MHRPFFSYDLNDSRPRSQVGDIFTVCVNAIHAGSTDANPEQWMLTQAILEREIAKAKKAKAEHSGEKGKNRRRIGFMQD